MKHQHEMGLYTSFYVHGELMHMLRDDYLNIDISSYYSVGVFFFQ